MKYHAIIRNFQVQIHNSFDKDKVISELDNIILSVFKLTRIKIAHSKVEC